MKNNQNIEHSTNIESETKVESEGRSRNFTNIEEMKKVRFSSGDNSDNEGGNDEFSAFDSVSGATTTHLEPKSEPINEGNVDSDNADGQESNDEEVLDVYCSIFCKIRFIELILQHKTVKLFIK